MERQIERKTSKLNRPVLRRLLWYREQLLAGGITVQQAVNAHEIHVRTFYRDIEYLRTLAWDLEFCRRLHRWVLRGGEAPLPVVRLAEGEALALLTAAEALRSYAGTPYAETVRRALEKLSELLEGPVTLDLGALPHFTGPPARQVDPGQYETLFRACRERRRLELEYLNPERGDLTTRRIDPYHLFDHAGDWYVAVWDHLRGEVRTFALGDRMRGLRETGETFQPDPQWSVERYLAEGFGLHRGGQVEEVVLRFAPSVARLMAEKVWAGTEEKAELSDGSLLLRMTVPVNTGLLRFVLQYGHECEVLEPRSLRCRVAREHRAAALTYMQRRSEDE